MDHHGAAAGAHAQALEADFIHRFGIAGSADEALQRFQEIAATAGLTKGAVYSQFDSKEDLLLALLDRRFELGHAQLLEVLSGDTPMAERITDLDTWHRGEKNVGRLWATLELELSLTGARQPKLRKKLRDRQRRSREYLTQMIEKIAEEHNLTLPLPAGEFAIVLSALSDGLLVHWLNDPKEIAEHNMIVDLHRNDIGRVAQFGTVKVRSLMDIKRFSHVQHISSEIVGIIAEGEDMFSALASNFPAGTLTGAPKIEAMKIINALENDGRGPYGGAVGHFSFNGDCTFAIPIRTVFANGEEAYVQTCGGNVYDSNAEDEYEEIRRKFAGTRKALAPFMDTETESPA